MGRAAGFAVVSKPLGGAGVRVGQHHGLSHCRTGTIRLRSGPAQPAAGQTLRAEGKEAARPGCVFKCRVACDKNKNVFLLIWYLHMYLCLYIPLKVVKGYLLYKYLQQNIFLMYVENKLTINYLLIL